MKPMPRTRARNTRYVCPSARALLPQLAGSAVPMQLVTSLLSGSRSLVTTGPPPVGVVGGTLAAARAPDPNISASANTTARIRQVLVTPTSCFLDAPSTHRYHR